MFGQDKPVLVRWQGKDYALMRLNALGAKGIIRFQKMYQEASELQSTGDELTDKQIDQVDALFDEMLVTLCKPLPVKSMPFLAKVNALTYYIDETEGKKALETALSKQTGEKSSAG